jgi:hypothetical protein
MTWPVSPWRRAFREDRCLPAGVRGPVECWELARLVSARWSEVGSGLVLVPLFESDIGLPFCYWVSMRLGAGVWGGLGN